MVALPIVRVGVVSVRYVLFEYARPWLIHSFKNTKGRTGSAAATNNPEEDVLKLEDDLQLPAYLPNFEIRASASSEGKNKEKSIGSDGGQSSKAHATSTLTDTDVPGEENTRENVYGSDRGQSSKHDAGPTITDPVLLTEKWGKTDGEMNPKDGHMTSDHAALGILAGHRPTDMIYDGTTGLTESTVQIPFVEGLMKSGKAKPTEEEVMEGDNASASDCLIAPDYATKSQNATPTAEFVPDREGTKATPTEITQQEEEVMERGKASPSEVHLEPGYSPKSHNKATPTETISDVEDTFKRAEKTSSNAPESVVTFEMPEIWPKDGAVTENVSVVMDSQPVGTDSPAMDAALCEEKEDAIFELYPTEGYSAEIDAPDNAEVKVSGVESQEISLEFEGVKFFVSHATSSTPLLEVPGETAPMEQQSGRVASHISNDVPLTGIAIGPSVYDGTSGILTGQGVQFGIAGITAGRGVQVGMDEKSTSQAVQLGRASLAAGQGLQVGTAGLATGQGVQVGTAEIAAGQGVQAGTASLATGQGLQVGTAGLATGQGVQVGTAEIAAGQGVQVGTASSATGQGLQVGTAGLAAGQGVQVGTASLAAGQGLQVGTAEIAAGQGVQVGTGGGQGIQVGIAETMDISEIGDEEEVDDLHGFDSDCVESGGDQVSSEGQRGSHVTADTSGQKGNKPRSHVSVLIGGQKNVMCDDKETERKEVILCESGVLEMLDDLSSSDEHDLWLKYTGKEPDTEYKTEPAIPPQITPQQTAPPRTCSQLIQAPPRPVSLATDTTPAGQPFQSPPPVVRVSFQSPLHTEEPPQSVTTATRQPPLLQSERNLSQSFATASHETVDMADVALLSKADLFHQGAVIVPLRSEVTPAGQMGQSHQLPAIQLAQTHPAQVTEPNPGQVIFRASATGSAIPPPSPGGTEYTPRGVRIRLPRAKGTDSHQPHFSIPGPGRPRVQLPTPFPPFSPPVSRGDLIGIPSEASTQSSRTEPTSAPTPGPLRTDTADVSGISNLSDVRKQFESHTMSYDKETTLTTGNVSIRVLNEPITDVSSDNNTAVDESPQAEPQIKGDQGQPVYIKVNHRVLNLSGESESDDEVTDVTMRPQATHTAKAMGQSVQSHVAGNVSLPTNSSEQQRLEVRNLQATSVGGTTHSKAGQKQVKVITLDQAKKLGLVPASSMVAAQLQKGGQGVKVATQRPDRSCISGIQQHHVIRSKSSGIAMKSAGGEDVISTAETLLSLSNRGGQSREPAKKRRTKFMNSPDAPKVIRITPVFVQQGGNTPSHPQTSVVGATATSSHGIAGSGVHVLGGYADSVKSQSSNQGASTTAMIELHRSSDSRVTGGKPVPKTVGRRRNSATVGPASMPGIHGEVMPAAPQITNVIAGVQSKPMPVVTQTPTAAAAGLPSKMKMVVPKHSAAVKSKRKRAEAAESSIMPMDLNSRDAQKHLEQLKSDVIKERQTLSTTSNHERYKKPESFTKSDENVLKILAAYRINKEKGNDTSQAIPQTSETGRESLQTDGASNVPLQTDGTGNILPQSDGPPDSKKPKQSKPSPKKSSPATSPSSSVQVRPGGAGTSRRGRVKDGGRKDVEEPTGRSRLLTRPKSVASSETEKSTMPQDKQKRKHGRSRSVIRSKSVARSETGKSTRPQDKQKRKHGRSRSVTRSKSDTRLKTDKSTRYDVKQKHRQSNRSESRSRVGTGQGGDINPSKEAVGDGSSNRRRESTPIDSAAKMHQPSKPSDDEMQNEAGDRTKDGKLQKATSDVKPQKHERKGSGDGKIQKAGSDVKPQKHERKGSGDRKIQKATNDVKPQKHERKGSGDRKIQKARSDVKSQKHERKGSGDGKIQQMASDVKSQKHERKRSGDEKLDGKLQKAASDEEKEGKVEVERDVKLQERNRKIQNVEGDGKIQETNGKTQNIKDFRQIQEEKRKTQKVEENEKIQEDIGKTQKIQKDNGKPKNVEGDIKLQESHENTQEVEGDGKAQKEDDTNIGKSHEQTQREDDEPSNEEEGNSQEKIPLKGGDEPSNEEEENSQEIKPLKGDDEPRNEKQGNSLEKISQKGDEEPCNEEEGINQEIIPLKGDDEPNNEEGNSQERIPQKGDDEPCNEEEGNNQEIIPLKGDDEPNSEEGNSQERIPQKGDDEPCNEEGGNSQEKIPQKGDDEPNSEEGNSQERIPQKGDDEPCNEEGGNSQEKIPQKGDDGIINKERNAKALTKNGDNKAGRKTPKVHFLSGKQNHRPQRSRKPLGTPVIQPTGTYERVRVIPRPWKTPEGTVNRPVLRMMTEGVLLHIMCQPGVTLQFLYAKYCNILQPVVVRELVEILEEVGCVTLTYLKVNLEESDLFSSRKTFVQGSLAESCDEGTIVTPTIDCILKMGQFQSQVTRSH